MTQRLNKQGWYVLVSITSDDGGYCVDVFEHPTGGFGFQHFRSDPEDLGGWTPIDGAAQPGYQTVDDAADAALSHVLWLTRHRRARSALDDWRASL